MIYCNVCCLNVVNAQSLHHKNDWTSRNLDHTLEILTFLHSYTECIFFSLLRKPIFPYEMSFYQNPIKYCNMAIYCNMVKHNTQYDIDPYCFTPTMYIVITSCNISHYGHTNSDILICDCLSKNPTYSHTNWL